MQDACEQRVRLSGAADVDDAGALKFLRENIDEEFEHVIIQRTQRSVDEHPRRLLYQKPREREAQLLVLTQFPIPSVRLIEQLCQTFQPKPVERPRKVVVTEAFGFQWIGENLA
jgi:hypothetical protein